jgi:radical SAM superfamily enzyme YgiQ (UPF0313 family)
MQPVVNNLTRGVGEPDLLLINPPLGPLLEPYISIPVLADYLGSRGIGVRGFDANRAFVVGLLNDEGIRKGLDFAERRYHELNGKGSLRYSECCEYYKMVSILIEAQVYRKELEWLSMPFSDFADIQKSPALRTVVRLVLLPYYPEVLVDEELSPRLGRYSGTSSRDILASIQKPDLLTPRLEEITREILNNYSPRIVGFSVVFADQLILAFRMAAMIKRRVPHIHLTMGGPHISIHFREVSEMRLLAVVDSLILDEGEIPLETLVRELSVSNGDIARVPGVITRQGERILRTPPSGPVDMMNTATPRYQVFDLNRYPKEKEDFVLAFRLSRGCSWRRCAFCRTGLYAIKHHQQPDKGFIYGRLLEVMEQTGCRKFLFSDDATDPVLLEYISRRLIQEKVRIKWKAHARVDPKLTRERCELYKQAGCIVLYLGIESLIDRLLKIMRKGSSASLIEKVLEEIGGTLRIGGYMMVGLPGESEEEAWSSFRTIEAYREKGVISNAYYSLFGITHDSEIGKNPERFGIKKQVVAEGEDLLPSVTHFTGTGMSRQKAHELYLKFTGQDKRSEKLGQWSSRLRVNGRPTPTQFDMQRVFETISSRWESIYMRYTDFLDFADQRCGPLERETAREAGR